MKSVDKQAIAAAFGRAAKSYSQNDELQRRSAKGLLRFLVERDFSIVLDAGCGPGDNSRFWRKTGSRVIALDLSPSMLRQARAQEAADFYLVADIEAIPLADARFDLVWSHLAVQWCESLPRALSELYRVARPGGLIAFTTLLANSLSELNQAWRAVDAQPHINHFLSYEEVQRSHGPWRIRHCKQKVTLYFSDVLGAMRSLKGVGATHLHHGRSTKLLTRHHLKRVERFWPKRGRQYPLTYQLFHGIIERD